MLYYHMVKGHWKVVWENTELRWYLGISLFFCGMVSMIIWNVEMYPGFWEALRHGTFQVVSLLTTTGLVTADYELWPVSAQLFLFTVCFVGACAGSTTSGIKIVHYVILWKQLKHELTKFFVHPGFIRSIRLSGQKTG